MTKKKPIRPPGLKNGETIGIAAPSSPFDRKKFEKGLSILKQAGFRVQVSDRIFLNDGRFPGSDRDRANHLNELFSDNSIKAIICARGGFGSMRILQFLDFKTIRENPKKFVGFSDITALLTTFYEKCDLVTFHGPTVTTLGEADDESVNALVAALTNDAPFSIVLKDSLTLGPGVAKGPLTGGNLSTICHLIGTDYWPGLNGHILFLEDRGEAPYRIDRMLSQIRLSGGFDGLRGLILGSFTECGPSDAIYRVINDIFQDVKIPILAGFPVGHGEKNLTIPIGLVTTLDARQQTLSFHEPAMQVD